MDKEIDHSTAGNRHYRIRLTQQTGANRYRIRNMQLKADRCQNRIDTTLWGKTELNKIDDRKHEKSYQTYLNG